MTGTDSTPEAVEIRDALDRLNDQIVRIQDLIETIEARLDSTAPDAALSPESHAQSPESHAQPDPDSEIASTSDLIIVSDLLHRGYSPEEIGQRLRPEWSGRVCTALKEILPQDGPARS